MTPEEMKRVFSKNLRDKRKERGLSQIELAEKIGAFGPYISDLEKGHKSPMLSTLAKLAEALGTSPDSLISVNS